MAGTRNWTYAFERQWLFYRLWGRLLYDPATPDSVFADEFTRRYGANGRNLLQAYELASATPLRLGSLFYSQWDHTLYSEGALWLNGRTMSYIGVEALISHLSTVCELLPGDLIFTGTPAGVGYSRTPARYLTPGAVVRSTVEGLGELRNRCVDANG